MWKELTAEDLRAKAAENAIVVLPVASMEQHGPHLPVGVDTFLCEAVCQGGAEIAVKDVPVVVAPTLWCGMAEHHMAFGGTFTFDIPDLPGGAGIVPGQHQAATASSACSSSTATAATSRRSTPFLPDFSPRHRAAALRHDLFRDCRRTTSRSTWKTRSGCITPARSRAR
jgi:hypothetical protein